MQHLLAPHSVPGHNHSVTVNRGHPSHDLIKMFDPERPCLKRTSGAKQAGANPMTTMTKHTTKRGHQGGEENEG